MKTNKILIITSALTVITLITMIYICVNQYKLITKEQKNTSEKLDFLSSELEVINTMLNQSVKAPDFELKDSNNQIKTLNSFKQDQIKVLVFGANGCEHCKEYYPILNQYAKQHKNIDVIVVQANSIVKENKTLKEKNNYKFTILEGNEKVIQDYAITNTPSTFILDKDNNVVNMGIIGTSEQLLDLIAPAL